MKYKENNAGYAAAAYSRKQLTIQQVPNLKTKTKLGLLAILDKSQRTTELNGKAGGEEIANGVTETRSICRNITKLIVRERKVFSRSIRSRLIYWVCCGLFIPIGDIDSTL